MSNNEEMPADAGLDTSVKTPPPEVETIEALCERCKTPDWLFAAVKMATYDNAEGALTTELEYRSACDHVANTPIGYRSQGLGELLKAHAAVDATDPKAVAKYDKDRRAMKPRTTKGGK